jgi:hypothetical protein
MITKQVLIFEALRGFRDLRGIFSFVAFVIFVASFSLVAFVIFRGIFSFVALVIFVAS